MTEKISPLQTLLNQRGKDRNLIIKNADGMIVVNSEGIVLYVNPAAEELMGRDSERIIGQTFGYLAEDGMTNEIEIIHPGKGILYAEMRVVEIEWDENVAFLASLRDITLRKEVETELAESEHRYRSLVRTYRALFDTSPDGVIIQQTGKLLFANPAFQTIFGIENLEERMDRSIEFPIAPVDRDRVLNINHARESGKKATTAYGYTGRREDGTEFPVEATAGRFELEDKPATMVILRDVTRRKAMQEYLVQNERLAAVGQMATGVAFEINTPLSNISLLADNLLETTRNEKAIKILKQIHEQVDLTAGIIRNLQETLEHGEIPQIELIDLHEVIEEALTGMELPQWVELERRLVKEAPIVAADAAQLQEAIVHLVRNAMEALKGKKSGSVAVATQIKQDKVEMIIADNGFGIPGKHRSRIFEPFFTTKPPGQGAGLGLSLVQRNISAIGGSIGLFTELERGTAITITLPLRHRDDPYRPGVPDTYKGRGEGQ